MVTTRRRLIGVVSLTLSAALLTACGSSGGSSSDSSGSSASSSASGGTALTLTEAQELSSAGKTDSTAFCGTTPITLAVHDGFGVNAWSQASLAAVRSEAAKCSNVTTVVQIGEGDLQKSISQVNSMVAQGANALVLIPDFGQAQLASIKAATDAGTKVVPWAADPGGTAGSDYVTYVDWSSPDAGTLWANWMVKTLGGKGNVVFIGGPAGNPVTAGQLKSVVSVFAQNPGMKLLTGDKDWPVTNWDPATAQKVTASLLAKYPQIDGIISDYGTDALAATRAMQAANRPLVPIATLEANGLGCLYQKEKAAGDTKFQLATISARNWLGRVAARQAIAAAEGIKIDEPSTFHLPLIEDSTAGMDPKCDSSQGDDFYNSNQITADELAKYGKP
jgi:ribose transport system substrate-binding protein